MPGAVAGALVTGLLPRRAFEFFFAVVLLVIAAVIILRPAPRIVDRTSRKGETTRMLTDRAGDTYLYSFNMATGLVLSLLVGFISSLLGIGGGVIHVPIMVQVLHFPAHVATATSHYVLTVTAATGTVTHLLTGEFNSGFDRVAALSIGVIAGAQVGARLSTRLNGTTIVRLLGLALAAVAVRLLVGALA